MRDDNCIFCKIANGEIPSATLYEDEDFRVILDLGPATKGHALILPKNHFGIFHVLISHFFGRVELNISPVAAGQTVFHFHIHLIPRYEGDHAGVTWKPGTLTDEEREEILQKWK